MNERQDRFNTLYECCFEVLKDPFGHAESLTLPLLTLTLTQTHLFAPSPFINQITAAFAWLLQRPVAARAPVKQRFHRLDFKTTTSGIFPDEWNPHMATWYPGCHGARKSQILEWMALRGS